MNCKVEMQIETEVNKKELQALSLIEKVLNEAANVERCPAVEVAVLIVDDARIRELNQQFRTIDRATDVLSFPQWDSGEEWDVNDAEEFVVLGDIVISLSRAREQAEEYGHSLQRELGFLAVHGFLHLIGYDHESKEDEEEMFAKQEEILGRIGLRR